MNTNIPDYFTDIVQEMALKSQAIRRDFATHRPSAGTNREQLVRDFLSSHLPPRFGVHTGLVVNCYGQFSKQADLIVTDALNNAPYYSQAPNPLWPVEAVYAMIEIKTNLTMPELRDCVEKCRRFKCLERRFFDLDGFKPLINDSLFVVWAYEAPDPFTVRQNLIQLLGDVPRN